MPIANWIATFDDKNGAENFQELVKGVFNSAAFKFEYQVPDDGKGIDLLVTSPMTDEEKHGFDLLFEGWRWDR